LQNSHHRPRWLLPALGHFPLLVPSRGHGTSSFCKAPGQRASSCVLPHAEKSANLFISMKEKMAFAIFIAKPIVALLFLLVFIASTRGPSCGAGPKGIAGRALAQDNDLGLEPALMWIQRWHVMQFLLKSHFGSGSSFLGAGSRTWPPCCGQSQWLEEEQGCFGGNTQLQRRLPQETLQGAPHLLLVALSCPARVARRSRAKCGRDALVREDVVVTAGPPC